MSSLWIETTKDEIQTSSLIKDEKTDKINTKCIYF